MLVRLTSGPKVRYGYSISTGKSRVTTRALHRVENSVFPPGSDRLRQDCAEHERAGQRWLVSLVPRSGWIRPSRRSAPPGHGGAEPGPQAPSPRSASKAKGEHQHRCCVWTQHDRGIDPLGQRSGENRLRWIRGVENHRARHGRLPWRTYWQIQGVFHATERVIGDPTTLDVGHLRPGPLQQTRALEVSENEPRAQHEQGSREPGVGTHVLEPSTKHGVSRLPGPLRMQHLDSPWTHRRGPRTRAHDIPQQ